jgi:hypothetical protein
MHVTSYGMHHRAQCLNKLRHLDVPGVGDRLPATDLLEWEATRGGAIMGSSPQATGFGSHAPP